MLRAESQPLSPVGKPLEELRQQKQSSRGLSIEVWRKVVIAIEDSIPLYDQVNNTISLGKAQVARSFALERLELKNGMCVLDSGIGPGPTSKLILSAIRPGLLVGLDGSVKQLQTAKENLSHLHRWQASRCSRDFRISPFQGRHI